MTLIEYFEKKIEEEIKNNKTIDDEKLIEYLQKNNSSISLKRKKYGYTEIMKFKQNPENYFNENPTLTVDENALEFSNLSLSQIKLLIANLSPEIKEIECPLAILKFLKLKNYPMLKKISINCLDDDNISFEKLMSIFNNSNIEEIQSEKDYEDDILKKSTFIHNEYEGELKGIINGKKIKKRPKTSFFIEKKVMLYSENIGKNIDMMFELMNEINKDNYEKIYFYDNFENYKKESFLDNYSKYSIQYKKDNDSLKSECVLNVNYLENIKELKQFIVKAKENGFEFDKINIKLENKDYEDIELLYSISKKYDTVIKYDAYTEIGVVDFISMRETLKYYKELILQQDLSPLEKALYGYDIIKSFVYKETESNDKTESRNIHSIIETGNIVCVGYANFYAQLMKEVGIEGCAFSTLVPVDDEMFGHKRCTLNIDDDKYNVHGSFAFDPTWDSARGIALVENSNGEEKLISTYKTNIKDDERIIKRYDDISRYKYFLIGKEDYQKVFKGEKMPDYTYATDYSKVVTKKDEIQEKFDLTNNSLPLDRFEKLITKIRICEGYQIEKLEETVADVLEVNGLIERKKVEECNYKM